MCTACILAISAPRMGWSDYILCIYIYIYIYIYTQNIWIPVMGEMLQAEIEPAYTVDKCTADKNPVSALISEHIARHIKQWSSGKFRKMLFHCLKQDINNSCRIKAMGNRCNLEDGKEMQIPCLLHFEGKKVYIDIVIANPVIYLYMHFYIQFNG